MIAETYNCGTGEGLEYGFWFKEHKHSPDRIFHICLGLATSKELDKGEDKIEEDFKEFRPLMSQMAAAPEMLAVLEHLVEKRLIVGMEVGEYNDHIDEVLETIAKARGEK